MNTELPVPERTLPPESAERIPTAIMFEEPAGKDRRVHRWMLGLAAALVVIALLATAAVLWPSTRQSQIVEQPTASLTPASAEPTPASTELPSATPAPSRTGPSQPGPKQEPFDTDLRALKDSTGRALIEECNAPADGVEPEKFEVESMPYVRRGTDGRRVLDLVIFRKSDGVDWLCAPDSGQTPVDALNPEIGPNTSFPVVADSGQATGAGSSGATSEWAFRALSSVERIQVRAVVKGEPQRWFEGEVHGGFAFVPVFTAGKGFKIDWKTFRLVGVTYEHRAFDTDGREVPVRVMERPR